MPVAMLSTRYRAPRHQRIGAVLIQPHFTIPVVMLFAPEHACRRLAHHPCSVLADGLRGDGGIELVGFLEAGAHDLVEMRPEGVSLGEAVPLLQGLGSNEGQTQPYLLTLPSTYCHLVMRRLGA